MARRADAEGPSSLQQQYQLICAIIGCVLTMLHCSRQAVSKLLSDPNWTRVVVLRDPIERFASGYLDKCCMFSASERACPDFVNRMNITAVLDALENKVRTLPQKVSGLDQPFEL